MDIKLRIHYILSKLLHDIAPKISSDSVYLRMYYRLNMEKKLPLKNPKTFNEKIQWLKVYDHDPKYMNMVDKSLAKEYAQSIIGPEHIIKTIGVWDNVEDIDISILPKQFVLKTTHGAGNTGVVICKDKSKFDIKASKAKLQTSMLTDTYCYTREWPYKNIKKRIIAEEFIEDAKTHELRDYKFFCFDGKVKALFVATDRQKRAEPFFDFFDESYNHLQIKQGHPNAPVPPEKPRCFEEMKAIAEKLSKGIPQVRVDLYEANGKVYFGELTFYHFGGIVPFEPNVWDEIFGNWLKLPLKQN